MPFAFFNPDSQKLFPSVLLQLKTFSHSADIFLVSRENGYRITNMLHEILTKFGDHNSPNVLIFRVIGAFYEIVNEGGEFEKTEFHENGVREMPFIIQERPIDDVALEITLNIPDQKISFAEGSENFDLIWQGEIAEFMELYTSVQYDPSTSNDPDFTLD